MQILTIETTTRIFDEQVVLQGQNILTRYILKPAEGKVLQDKRTKKLILGSVQVGLKSHIDFYEEVDIPEHLQSGLY